MFIRKNQKTKDCKYCENSYSKSLYYIIRTQNNFKLNIKNYISFDKILKILFEKKLLEKHVI